MEKTYIILDPAYPIAEVDPRIFGGFLEHMVRAVYQGVFDPDSAHADENCFRRDVMGALRQLPYDYNALPGRQQAAPAQCQTTWVVGLPETKLPACAL